MEIRDYEASDCEAAARLYTRVTARVPYCGMVSPDSVKRELGTHTKGLEQERVLVAREAGKLTGFIHAGINPEGASGEPEGIIRFLATSQHGRAAGQALLESVHRVFRQAGVSQIRAFPQEYRYPFYMVKAAYLSIHIEQVHALLLWNKYQVSRGEVFLEWRDFPHLEPGPCPVPGTIRIEHLDSPGELPDIHLQFFSDDTRIGECRNVSCAHYQHGMEMSRTIFTTWLGIAEPYQGRGLGRHLLFRALQEARETGYRHALISTALPNHRAFLFYAYCGYRLVDWTYELTRRPVSERDGMAANG